MQEIIIARVKEALSKALEDVKNTQLGLVEKISAIDSLSYARLRLEESPNNPDSMSTYILVLHNKKKAAVLKAIFNNHSHLRKLYSFGSTSWVSIQMIFRDAGIECPLALRSFHTAYQRELQLLS